MEWYWLLLMLLGSILFLMFIGLPVGLAFITVNTVALTLIYIGQRGGPFEARLLDSVFQLTDNAYANMAVFAIVPIPMFLLMGELFFHTGLAATMFNAIEKLMGKVPARLSYVTVAGGTAFATLSGSSMGSTALLGTLMVPEMSRRGYKKHMSIGPILGTGGLAMLIPPSALAVFLGTLAELDIGKLLIAGVLPGLILASMYAILIFARATLDPDAAPSYDVSYVPWSQRVLLFVLDVLPMISIIILVILLIMLGIATPSESAAYGSVGVIFLALIYLLLAPLLRGLYLRGRRDDPQAAAAAREAFADVRSFVPRFGRALWKSLWGAGRVTVIALLILFGSSLFSNVLATSQASDALIKWVTGFDVSGYVMLLIMFGILLMLGMFMDQLAMMLLTVPIFFPIIKGLDFGLPPDAKLIWFGIIMLLAMEISFTTPPFGLLLFVMQGVAPPGTKFGEICMAAIPFMACAMFLVALIIIFPWIATWLPFIGG